MGKMEQRELTRIKCLFDQKNSSNSVCFITSSSDTGVTRNFGRYGARFAPQAILNEFKKMIFPTSWKSRSFNAIEVANTDYEKENFQQAQLNEAENILNLLKRDHSFIHLGGGHDHVYPMLKAMLSNQAKKIAIINIDAHADTRVDEEFHSGTPFRQISNEHPDRVQILQIGLQHFANSSSTLSDLKCQQEQIFYSKHQNWIKTVEQALTQFLVRHMDAMVFISLDVDAIESSVMSAVSAVNPQGIDQNQIEFVLSMLRHHAPQGHLGIYEYNPLYEDLSNKGAKFIAKIIYDWLND
jgi:formiminoglutamase